MAEGGEWTENATMEFYLVLVGGGGCSWGDCMAPMPTHMLQSYSISRPAATVWYANGNAI